MNTSVSKGLFTGVFYAANFTFNKADSSLQTFTAYYRLPLLLD